MLKEKRALGLRRAPGKSGSLSRGSASNFLREPFYLVWNWRHGYPTHRHPTFDIAKTEAIRLACKFPTEKFGVFRVLFVYQTLNSPTRLVEEIFK